MRFFILLLVIGLCTLIYSFVSPLMANSEELVLGKGLSFEWTFPQIRDTAGFKIYLADNQTPILLVDDPASRKASIPDYDVPLDESCYAMTAIDVKGHESPQSAKFCIDPPPPVPTGFKVIWSLVPIGE